jgi:hypothetical protein
MCHGWHQDKQPGQHVCTGVATSTHPPTHLRIFASAAQGLDLSRARPGLGASWTYDMLHAAYSKTRKWQQAYKLAPRDTCR